jgi:uncharacterized protein involved in oxidation of intracellular sulfur
MKTMSENKKNYLVIINDSPYGNERPYNALRLAMNLTKRPEALVRVFLIGDGVNCAMAGQKTPDGYYNVERMFKLLTRRGEVAT